MLSLNSLVNASSVVLRNTSVYGTARTGRCILQTHVYHRSIESCRLEGMARARLVLPPAQCRSHLSRLPRATSCQVWRISKDGDATLFLGNLAQCLTTLMVFFFSLYWIGISHNYPCIPLPLVISRCTSVRIRVSSSLVSLIQQLQAAISFPFHPQFPRQCRPSYLSSSLYVLPIASVLPLTCSTLSISFLNWGDQSWRRCSRCSLTSARKRGVIRSLRLPAVLLLKQPRMLLAFLAARAHCWFTMSSSSTGTSSFFFLQIGFLATWPPASPVAWGYSISDAGLCILMYWIKIIEFYVLDYNFVLVRTNSFEFAIGE